MKATRPMKKKVRASSLIEVILRLDSLLKESEKTQARAG